MGMPFERALALQALAIYSPLANERRNALVQATHLFESMSADHHTHACRQMKLEMEKHQTASKLQKLGAPHPGDGNSEPGGSRLFGKLRRGGSTVATVAMRLKTMAKVGPVALRPTSIDLCCLELDRPDPPAGQRAPSCTTSLELSTASTPSAAPLGATSVLGGDASESDRPKSAGAIFAVPAVRWTGRAAATGAHVTLGEGDLDAPATALAPARAPGRLQPNPLSSSTGSASRPNLTTIASEASLEMASFAAKSSLGGSSSADSSSGRSGPDSALSGAPDDEADDEGEDAAGEVEEVQRSSMLLNRRSSRSSSVGSNQSSAHSPGGGAGSPMLGEIAEASDEQGRPSLTRPSLTAQASLAEDAAEDAAAAAPPEGQPSPTATAAAWVAQREALAGPSREV